MGGWIANRGYCARNFGLDSYHDPGPERPQQESAKEESIADLRAQLKDAGELLKLAEAVMYDNSKAAEFYERYGDHRAKYGEVE
jgi:hypothetical protein